MVEEISVEVGGEIYGEAQGADAWYILGKGSVALTYQSAESQPVTVTEFSCPGDSFGELALLGDGVRALGAQATKDSNLLRISREAFDNFREKEPVVAQHFLYALAREIAELARSTAAHGKMLVVQTP